MAEPDFVSEHGIALYLEPCSIRIHMGRPVTDAMRGDLDVVKDKIKELVELTEEIDAEFDRMATELWMDPNPPSAGGWQVVLTP